MTRQPTTSRAASPSTATVTESTSLLSDAVAAGSVTLSHRHEIATDLRTRRLTALERAARDQDEDAKDAAERGYDAAMQRLLMLPVRPICGVEKWRELDFTSADPAMHTHWED